MSMTLEEAINRFHSMNDGAKVQMLGRLCFDLTIEVRSFVSELASAHTSLERLKGINEIQHKALAQMLAYQSGRSDRYPDRDFFLLLVRLGKSYGVAGRVQQSLIDELKKTS